MNSPETIFESGELPDDLKWLGSQFKLQPNDPAFLLLAWHWKRVQQTGDIIHNTNLQLKAALDIRIEKVLLSNRTLECIVGILSETKTVLETKHLNISKQINDELGQPISASVQACSNLGTQLQSLLQETRVIIKNTKQQQLFAAFVAGLFVGSMLIPWTYFHFFSHS